jgi:hypothetical protein
MTNQLRFDGISIIDSIDMCQLNLMINFTGQAANAGF